MAPKALAHGLPGLLVAPDPLPDGLTVYFVALRRLPARLTQATRGLPEAAPMPSDRHAWSSRAFPRGHAGDCVARRPLPARLTGPCVACLTQSRCHLEAARGLRAPSLMVFPGNRVAPESSLPCPCWLLVAVRALRRWHREPTRCLCTPSHMEFGATRLPDKHASHVSIGRSWPSGGIAQASGTPRVAWSRLPAWLHGRLRSPRTAFCMVSPSNS